jgi:MscS family membrane protein
VSLLTSWVVLAVARMLVRRTEAHHDDAIVELAVGPVRLMLGVAAFTAGLQGLWLPVNVHGFFTSMARGVFIVAVTWLVVRIVAVISRVLQLRMAQRGDRVGISAVPLIRRVVSALIVLLGGIVIVGTFGVNVTGLVAGLGVGGLAVALAAQKSLENLFGGLTLIVDQPVHVGDFCRFGDRVGTVEDIGLRSTRIRTLDRTLVTIPNSEFSSMQIENFARRDRIWLATTIGVRYETTPDQLRFLLISLKRMLLAHPMIDPDPARVRFSGFGASSLDIDIFAYVRTTDINEFYAVREDVFLRIMEVVGDAGTGFAFPSQTIYAAADTGVDTERGSAAAAQVAQWRGAGELSMPNPSPRVVDEIADTLDYPPKGSASSG